MCIRDSARSANDQIGVGHPERVQPPLEHLLGRLYHFPGPVSYTHLTGRAQVVKTSANPAISNANGNYSLANAVFGAFSTCLLYTSWTTRGCSKIPPAR